MDTAQWPQEILVKPPSMEDMIPHATTPPTTTCSNNNIISTPNNNNNNNNNNLSKPSSTSLERKVRPTKDQAVNCPRCNSTNTKFCYYNNYSLTQPRYFCKTCRRYWTEGGSLRNIPVGGGSRKNKRSSASTSPAPSSSPSSKRHHHDQLVAASTQQQQQQQQLHHHHHTLNPKLFHHHQGQDLNLGFPPNHHLHPHQQHHPQSQHQQQEFRSLSEFMQLPTIDNVIPKQHIPNSGVVTNQTSPTSNGNGNGNGNGDHLSALELLNGLTSTRGLTPFMPMPVPDPNGVYTSGFGMHDYKPSLNFSLVDGLGNGYEVHQHQHQQQATNDSNTPNNNNNNGRLLFPFEDLKQVSSTTSADHTTTTTTNNSGDNHDQNGSGGGGGGEQGDSTPPGYWSGMLGNGGSW